MDFLATQNHFGLKKPFLASCAATKCRNGETMPTTELRDDVYSAVSESTSCRFDEFRKKNVFAGRDQGWCCCTRCRRRRWRSPPANSFASNSFCDDVSLLWEKRHKTFLLQLMVPSIWLNFNACFESINELTTRNLCYQVPNLLVNAPPEPQIKHENVTGIFSAHSVTTKKFYCGGPWWLEPWQRRPLPIPVLMRPARCLKQDKTHR